MLPFRSRYRVLSLVGEGTFSQLAVAEDTFAPSPPSQHHLAGMYGCATCSEVPQASAAAAAAAAAGRPNVIPRHRLVALKIMNSKYAFIGVQELDKLFTLNQRDQRSWCPIVRVQGPGAFYFHTHLVLVLELLGPALLSYMKNLPRGRVPVDQLRKIALQLVLALGYVSTAGMIHGDIKPENCLLEPRGRGVKVKLVSEEEQLRGDLCVLVLSECLSRAPTHSATLLTVLSLLPCSLIVRSISATR